MLNHCALHAVVTVIIWELNTFYHQEYNKTINLEEVH